METGENIVGNLEILSAVKIQFSIFISSVRINVKNGTLKHLKIFSKSISTIAHAPKTLQYWNNMIPARSQIEITV